MALRQLHSATLQGLNAKLVEVEASLNKGLPSFTITGMAQASIQEARHRSQSALCAIARPLPPLKIVINLAPSDLPKHGSHFDLPIALLIALYHADIAPSSKRKWLALGELGLDGHIKDNKNIYPILLSLAEQRYDGEILIPAQNDNLYAQIPGLKLHFVATLDEAIDSILSPKQSRESNHKFPFSTIEIDGIPYYYEQDFILDFRDIKGQEIAKRAALIAAAGFHNILMEGSPGIGKSMIAKRMRYILPPISKEEILKSAKAHLHEHGELKYSALRNERTPHNTSTKAAMLGSVSANGDVHAGEIALAHDGILFLDELPHFPKSILEALREPLENHSFIVSRAQAKVEFEASFLLVAAQNPCPCGNLLNQNIECRCNDAEIARYKSHLSDPFLDRIDLFVAMQNANIQATKSISSKELHERVLQAFIAQKKRGQVKLNGKLDERGIEEFCTLSNECEEILLEASRRFSLSHRAVAKIKRVSRTIADLDGAQNIAKPHLLEALSYRRR